MSVLPQFVVVAKTLVEHGVALALRHVFELAELEIAQTDVFHKDPPSRHTQSLSPDFVGLREPGRRESYSERSAWITSTRAARAAGHIEATMAAASTTSEEPTTGKTSGICISRTYLPIKRATA